MNRITKTTAIAALAAIGVVGTAAAASAAPAPAPAKTTGTVTWDYQGQVTGQVIFNANAKTGGSLDYKNSWGQWLHGVVNPDTVRKLADGSVVFAGEITGGSDDYTVNHEGTDYFSAKVVDGGTSGRDVDMIAVLANEDGHGHALDGTAVDYDVMGPNTAGIVTAGNLTVF
jgi:hypothetical protein